MPAEKRLRISFGALRFFRDRAGALTFLGILSLVSAIFQAIALMLVVPLAGAVDSKSHEWQKNIAGLHIVVSTEMLALLAAGAIVAAAIFDITISWFRARLMTDWDYENREAVVAEYLNTDYPTQAAERLGTLGLLTT
jgi:hypothetical protein